ncbi:carbohydrate kinase family protein [Modestobacter sp. URMC 112]
MTGLDVATVGELTVDDVVIEDVGTDWKQPGGGALYSAAGALLWSTEVGVAAAVGADYPASSLERIAAAGVDVAAVSRTDGLRSISLWLLHETTGRRRQLEKDCGGTMRELDAARPPLPDRVRRARGVHLAPQSSAGHQRALRELRGSDAVTTLDLFVEPFVDTGPYTDGSALDGVDVFLPSEQEVADLWGHDDPRRLGAELRSLGPDPLVVVKRGADGVDVLDSGSVVRVPAVPIDLVDPTGAGDAFCGGFLATFVRTGDPVEAAVTGSVSASFVCETRGALAAIGRLDADLALSRRAALRRRLRSVA